MGMNGMTAKRRDPIIFPTAEDMTRRLAMLFEYALKSAIAERGVAAMALSGGSSPRALYQTMSHLELDWASVDITVVDERWVPPAAPGSNEKFIRETLMQNNAKSANFVSLYTPDAGFSDAAPHLNEKVHDAFPRGFDIVVMGMGSDGHTASWFPSSSNLVDVLNSEELVIATEIPASDKTTEYRHRMTLTPKALLGARLVCLPLTGEAKAATFGEVILPGEATVYPVRQMLDQTPDIWVTWAPAAMDSGGSR